MYSKRSIARLTAVQALYSTMITQEDPESLEATILDILSHFYEDAKQQPDLELLKTLALGAYRHRSAIDSLLKEHLSKHDSTERMNILMHALLRVAIYELQLLNETPAKIIVNEYTNLAKQFFNASSEVGFVNAILDTLAKKMSQEG